MERQPATRLVVDRNAFMQRAAALGFKNVDAIVAKARQEGIPLGQATVYQVLGNGNYQRDSLEKLAEVTGISLDTFVEFRQAIDRRHT